MKILDYLRIIRSMLGDIKRSFQEKKRAYQWRYNNKHNYTIIRNILGGNPIITIGEGTYGELNILSYENKEEGLEIGNFVSIASNVWFILGGNHQMNTYSNYPIASKFIELCPEKDALTKGKIIIEDEVWIGANVTILSGITIAKGAIVAAGSVVTKDVAPYSIIGGNPAKIIRYRNNKELRLMLPNLIDIPKKVVLENIDLFYKELSEEVVQQIKNSYFIKLYYYNT